MQLLRGEPAPEQAAQDSYDGIGETAVRASLDHGSREGSGEEPDHDPANEIHVRHS
jgi:hypothetical protein